MNTNLALGLGR